LRELFLELPHPVSHNDECVCCSGAPAGHLLGHRYNPFFVIQFLTALSEEGLLWFDTDAAAWDWDLVGIRAKGFTDNIVDLMVRKLSRLPLPTIDALKQLACLGHIAKTATLARASGGSEEESHAALWDAVHSGLVLRLNCGYMFLRPSRSCCCLLGSIALTAPNMDRPLSSIRSRSARQCSSSMSCASIATVLGADRLAAEACSGVVHRSGLFLRCSLIESFKMAEGSVCIGLRAFAGVLQSFFPFKCSSLKPISNRDADELSRAVAVPAWWGRE
jgi:hypothetical protein